MIETEKESEKELNLRDICRKRKEYSVENEKKREKDKKKKNERGDHEPIISSISVAITIVCNVHTSIIVFQPVPPA